MYSIKKNFVRFCSEANYSINLLKKQDPIHGEVFMNRISPDPKYVYIKSYAALNQIWQSWNHFWRLLWLTHFYGSEGFTKQIPSNNLTINNLSTTNIPEEEAVFHILSAARYNMSRYRNNKVMYFQEPTWGDITCITKLATAFSSNGLGTSKPGDRISSALSVFGDSSKDLQAVRNSAVHISKSNMLEIKANITPKYNITQIKYPTDIMYATRIGTQTIAIVYWIDELITLLELLE
ncbi:hypothetical protein MKY89_27880 [Bacillus sp. FSL W7-1294]|uniref:hypothetical protein n=1 Tax=Bacillus TaxID=1386 RepID=UPI00077A9561|nr:hypothetical protein [Bacillus cereus]KXY70692.1 hypothetical protein AT270_27230 [Bacillus cereus]